MADADFQTRANPKPFRVGSLETMLRGRPHCPKGSQLAPSPRAMPIAGHHLGLKDPLLFFTSARRDHGDVVRFRFAGVTGHLVSSPELIQEVLQTRHKEFNKQTRGIEMMKLMLGEGLVTSEGESWLKHRRIAQPAFHRKRIASFAERMVTASDDLVETFRDAQEVDAHDLMMRLTLRIVGETLLGTDVTNQASEIGDAVSFIVEDTNVRVRQPLVLPTNVPTKRNRAFNRHKEILDRIVSKIIRERRKQTARPDDLLTMLMDTTDDETGERMDDQQLRDEVMTIFLAGHETTANALTWTLYLLSKHPDARRRLREEVRAIKEPLTAAHLPQLEFCKWVVQEAMRLFPPVWVTARGVAEDTEIDGYFLPKESLVFVSPWVVHRDPKLYPNPEGFDPDRFATQPNRFAYFPFGAGPRMCIGKGFAMLEAQLLLATLVRDWDMDLVPGHAIVPEPALTLRPKTGMPMRLRRVSAP